MTREPGLADQVAALFPVDGPYGDDDTKAAGRMLEHAVRYLCLGTRHPEAVTEPGTVDSVTHSLHDAVVGFDQLLRQLDRRLDALAATGRLYDDTGEDPAIRVDEWQAAAERARNHLGEAAAALRYGAGHSNHLGLRDDDEDGQQ